MIFIYCDSYWRDALGIGLLSQELNSRGIDTSVVPFDIWPQINDLLITGDIVIINHGAGKRNRQIYEAAKKRGAFVCIMHTEGRPNTTEQVGWYRDQDGVGDSIFAWSSLIGNIYKKTTPVVTGNPRFDIYRPEFRYLLEDTEIVKSVHGLSPEREIILVNSGHPQAKFQRSAHSFNRRDWKDLNVPFDPDEESEHDYTEREKFLNLIILLNFWAKDNNYQIVVKPHPMESSIYWEKEAERYGFSVITQEFVHNLINVASVVVNRGGCTTTLESALLSKPVISIEEPRRKGLAFDTFQVAHHAKNSEDLIKFVLGKSSIKADHLLGKLGIVHKNPSHINIADYLSEIETPKSRGRMFSSQRVSSKVMEPYSVPLPGFNPGKQLTPFRMNELYSFIKRKRGSNE